jgi:hypothetical protein
MRDSVKIEFDAASAMAGLDQLAEEAAVNARPAAQAGAQVFYDEVKVNVSKLGTVTGNLAASIYQVYSTSNSSTTKATYHVSWNYRKAPHGHLVEYGHIQTRKVYLGSNGRWYTSKTPLPAPVHVAAKPFLRPAYDSKVSEALKAANVAWQEGMRAAMPGVVA